PNANTARARPTSSSSANRHDRNCMPSNNATPTWHASSPNSGGSKPNSSALVGNSPLNAGGLCRNFPKPSPRNSPVSASNNATSTSPSRPSPKSQTSNRKSHRPVSTRSISSSPPTPASHPARSAPLLRPGNWR